MKLNTWTTIILCAYLLTACNLGVKKQAGNVHDGSHEHHQVEHHEHHAGEVLFSEQKAEMVGLQVEQVELQPFASVIHTSGKIEMLPGEEYTIVAPSEGIADIMDTKLAEGTFVGEGARLMTISATSLQNGDPAVKAKIEYQVAEKDYLRAQKLVDEKIISQKEFEQTELRYEIAKAAWLGQSGKLTEKGVAVLAPATGYFMDLLVGQGEYVSSGQPVAKMMKNNKVRLIAEVAESHYSELPALQTANFRTAYEKEARSIDSLGGKLISYARTTHGESSFIPVTFELNNDGTLLAGAYADIWLLAKQREEAIVVPITSIIEEQGLYFVFTKIDHEVYKKQEVRLGQNDGKRVEVLEGLHVGEQVVVKGAIQLKLSSASAAIPAHNHNH